MARTATRTAKTPSPQVVAHERCPECGAGLPTADEKPPKHLLCSFCAAIAIWDLRTGHYRLLWTQEWLDLTLLPHFYDLLEQRMALLEQITAPPEPKGHVQPLG